MLLGVVAVSACAFGWRSAGLTELVCSCGCADATLKAGSKKDGDHVELDAWDDFQTHDRSV